MSHASWPHPNYPAFGQRKQCFAGTDGPLIGCKVRYIYRGSERRDNPPRFGDIGVIVAVVEQGNIRYPGLVVAVVWERLISTPARCTLEVIGTRSGDWRNIELVMESSRLRVEPACDSAIALHEYIGATKVSKEKL